MAEGGPSRGKTEKPRAQSIWGGIPNLRKSIIKNRWRKHSDDANSRTATILPNPHLDDTLLQTIPGSVSSVTVENPYVEQVDKDSATAQDPGEDIPNILNVDGLDEQNSSILTDGYRQSKLTAKVVKILTIVFLFSVILVCATLSKLCLVAITTQMHHALTVNFPMQPANNPFDDWPEDTDRFNDTTDSETELTRRNAQQSMNSTVRITKQQQSIAFIQVVIVLMASQLVTFLRMMFGGIIGKSSATYPWPSIGAIALGLVVTVLEAGALCAFVILVATLLGPLPTLLLIPGIYAFTGMLRMCCCCCSYFQFKGATRSQYDTECTRRLKRLGAVLDNPFFGFVGMATQVAGLIGAGVFTLYKGKILNENVANIDNFQNVVMVKMVGCMVAVPLLLSILWSAAIQKLIYHSSPKTKGKTDGNQSRNSSDKLPASRRGGFLYAGIRLVVIPFIAYGFAVSNDHEIDIAAGFRDWTSIDIAIVTVQVVASLLTFCSSLISLWTTLQRWTFTLPLLLSTPAAVAWFWLAQIYGVSIFPFYRDTLYFPTTEHAFYDPVSGILALLWLSQFLVLGYHIWVNPKYSLAREKKLFVSPYYDNIFIDSYLLLNRYSAQILCLSECSGAKCTKGKPAVFICSTMYHESRNEMKQMLTSINRVAVAVEKQVQRAQEGREHFALHDRRIPHFESHIFFDGAVKANILNEFLLQLMSLLEETLHVNLSNVKKIRTPYGYQMRWNLASGYLPFCVHLKDNTKVKNKKRWSQVMYMSYVVKHKLKELNDYGRLKYDPDHTYILTTDADIDFKAKSVAALLDFLARDDSVGAVCARTHPLGSGPLVWYQMFEYAFGHWFQKSAEHVLGCVLCCPGCFAVFRASAIADVLETYQSSVTSASEFLTKDMGEDRWLCTLLIQKGWRLEYAALPENSTFCPEDFNEFFNQRRRWVPSTVANLMQLIVQAKSIVAANDSISYLFILYQVVIIMSTAISPATVVLIVASGLFSAYGWDTNISVGIISTVSILYGIMCIKCSEKVQLLTAKLLTLAFAILMTVAFTGIFTGTINFLENPDNLATPQETFSVDGVYLWGFSAIVLIAGMMHFKEFLVLLHFIWYMLALPSAYMLLLIYSAANLNNRSWGTRVGATTAPVEKATNLNTIRDKVVENAKQLVTACWARITKKKQETATKMEAPPIQTPELPIASLEEGHSGPTEDIPLDNEVEEWLREQDATAYLSNFRDEGYTNFRFIADMSIQDMKAIGINKNGFLLRLHAAIKQLPTVLYESRMPKNVEDFLTSPALGLPEYLDLFKREGYYFEGDLPNLIILTKDELKKFGITKRAHLNAMTKGLKTLRYPTSHEVSITRTRATINNAPESDLVGSEKKFWDGMVDGVLQAAPKAAGNNTDELRQGLEELRNNTLVAMLVINVLWIVVLLSIQLTYFSQFGIRQSLLPIAFSVLYFGVILAQFLALVVHRLETLVHVVARANL